MWTYLALMIHVREKDPTEHNGWESYVAAKMAAKDTSFMPRSTALVLLASEAADRAAQQEVHSRLAALEAQVKTQGQQMMSLLEAVVERLPSKA
jgi:hypothetical protein